MGKRSQRMEEKRRKKGHKLLLFLTLIGNLILIGGLGYLIYNISLLNNIENELRLIGSIILFVICLILLILSIRFYKKYKRGKLIFIIFLMMLIGLGTGFIGYNVDKVYSVLDDVSDTSGYKTYSSSLVTLSTNDVSSIDNIGDEAIGMISDDTSIDGYEIPKEVIKKQNISNEIKDYSNYIEMIDALYAGEVKYIFLPTNYSVMFGSMEGYEDIKDKTKIIFTQKKKVKEKDPLVSSKGKSINSPFTILLMGVDSEEEGIKGSSFNGDSLMVITFNPKTLGTTILSIPRDSYVPIACFSGKKKNKITHAAWQGEGCMIKTIQNLLDVDIDYYVKINFKGAVSLVDALGGVEIDVPYNLCEQDSNRAWGANTVYIRKGLQNLNGEQALAYSRNRHSNPDMCSKEWTNYTSNDFIRGQHQQEVVTALLDKFKAIKDLNTVYKLLDTISNNMVTNMSTDQILSLYNVFKDIASKANSETDMADVIGLQRLYLNGYDARIVDYGGSNLSLYNYVLYDESVKEVSNAMKENLGIKKAKVVKSFSFDVNTPYEKVVIGQKTTGKRSLVLIPNFVGQSLSSAQSWCSSHGIKASVSGGNGYVVSQSVPAGANVEDVKSITLSAGGSKTEDKITKNDEKETIKKDSKNKEEDNSKNNTVNKEESSSGNSEGSSDGGSTSEAGGSSSSGGNSGSGEGSSASLSDATGVHMP